MKMMRNMVIMSLFFQNCLQYSYYGSSEMDFYDDAGMQSLRRHNGFRSNHEHNTYEKFHYKSRDHGGKCVCSCRRCLRPKPCCFRICNQCPPQPLLVPYPVPFFMPLIIDPKNGANGKTENPTNTEAPQTTNTEAPQTTNTEAPKTTTTSSTTTATSAMTATDSQTTRTILTEMNYRSTSALTVRASPKKMYIPGKEKLGSKIICRNNEHCRPTYDIYPRSRRYRAPHRLPRFGLIPLSDEIIRTLVKKLRGETSPQDTEDNVRGALDVDDY